MNLSGLQSCDILLYKGSSLTSKLIEWNTKSLYSHVAVVVGPQMHLGIESNTGSQAGVRAFDLQTLDKTSVDVFRVKPEFPFQKEQVISYLVGHLGAGYDTWGVAYLGILKFFNLKDKANRWQIDHDYFCSELVYEAFHAAGLDIVPQIGEGDTTSPGDIAGSPVVETVTRDSGPKIQETRDKIPAS